MEEKYLAGKEFERKQWGKHPETKNDLVTDHIVRKSLYPVIDLVYK